MENVIPHHIHYKAYEPDGTAIKAVIILLHGMQEHSGRYGGFANYLREQGYAVFTYDHTGHGRTAKAKEQLGFFRTNKPGSLLVEEAEQLSASVSQRFPGVPLILMGHSMGSFIARILLKRAPYQFDGTILIGTGGPNRLAALFLPILYMVNLLAPRKRSRWLNKLFLTINNRKFKHEQPNDGTNWLSADLANRKAFLDDGLCGVDFSNNAFLGLISLNVEATKSSWMENIPRTMPFFFASGMDDPIGDFREGVEKTVRGLREHGFERVDLKLYPGMRHEILNEDDRQQVFDNIFEWLEKTTKSVPE